MDPCEVWCSQLGIGWGINGQWTSAREKCDYVTMIRQPLLRPFHKEEAAEQQEIRLEEGSVKRYRPDILFAVCKAEYPFVFCYRIG